MTAEGVSKHQLWSDFDRNKTVSGPALKAFGHLFVCQSISDATQFLRKLAENSLALLQRSNSGKWQSKRLISNVLQSGMPTEGSRNHFSSSKMATGMVWHVSVWPVLFSKRIRFGVNNWFLWCTRVAPSWLHSTWTILRLSFQRSDFQALRKHGERLESLQRDFARGSNLSTRCHRHHLGWQRHLF